MRDCTRNERQRPSCARQLGVRLAGLFRRPGSDRQGDFGGGSGIASCASPRGLYAARLLPHVSCAMEENVTLARKLGTTAHLSLLLRKAR